MEAATNTKKKLHIPTWRKLPYNDCQIKNSHSSTLIKNKILTFGGVNNEAYLPNITLYDLQKEIIEHVKTIGQPARGREGHSACLYEKNQIIIHGGCCQFDDWDVTYEVGILTLKETDPPSVTYEIIETESEEEIRRYGHSAHIYENKMYVFGGCDPDWKGTNDLFCLHLDTWSWERLNPNGILPEKVYDQCSVLYNDQMFVYGGITPQTKKNLNTLYMLNLSTMFWRKVEGKGKLPGPLAGASAQEKDGEIFIFGGANQRTETNELYKYNIRENTWKEVITMEEPPLIRHWHSCVIVNNQMYIWGGKYGSDHLSDIYCLDLEPARPKRTIYREGNSNAILEQLWKEKLMSDVILKVEGEEIPAHKSIISAGCKYFYGMFKSGMIESTANVIEIPGIKASSLKAMLEYIYCNKIEINEDLALGLLEPSDKFLLSDLRDGCERFLVQCLNLENFVKIFKMTVDLETELLRGGFEEFITMNSSALKKREDVKALPEDILMRIHPDLGEAERK